MSRRRIKKILGMRVHEYRGCGGCPVVEACEAKQLTKTRTTLRHTGDQRWDNWGTIVSVFRPGDLVEITLRHDGHTIYCGTGAESTLYPGVTDYVHLENFSPP